MGNDEAKRSAIAEGGGSSTGGTPKPRVTPSQSASRARPNNSGIDRLITNASVALAGLLGFVAVVAAALGAHGPLAEVEETRRSIQAIASVTGLHAVALLVLTVLQQMLAFGLARRLAGIGALLFGAGAVLFAAGVVAGLAGVSALGPLAPIGGGTLMLGWLACVGVGLASMLRR